MMKRSLASLVVLLATLSCSAANAESPTKAEQRTFPKPGTAPPTSTLPAAENNGPKTSSAATSTAAHAKDITPLAAIAAGAYVRCQRCGPKDRIEITTRAFRIDQDEVTQAQYAECVAARSCAAASVTMTNPDEPVRGVSWIDASNYCKFVDKRLPTEAEWERAAYPTSGAPSDDGPRIGREPCVALLIGGYDGEACPGRPLHRPESVALKIIAADKNAFVDDKVVSHGWPALYDLYGNVAEWTADWDGLPNNPEYYFTPKTRSDPVGPPSGKRRIIRGGSFAAMTGSMAGQRRREEPTERPPDVGFRCAADQ